MVLERLREVEWKSVFIIAVPLLIITLLIGFLLLRDDGVSADILRRGQYSESAQNVRVVEASPSRQVGDYALVPAEVKVEDAEDPNKVTIDYDAESTVTVTAGEKLGEDDPESVIDPSVDGEPVPEGEEADDSLGSDESVVVTNGDGTQPANEPLTLGHLITEENDLYTVNFYPADEFLASGRFASEEEADFSINALEELIEGVEYDKLRQIGFVEGVGHTGAYVSFAYSEEDADEKNPPAFFRAYVTDGDIVAVIEGSTEGGSHGYRPDFLAKFNLAAS